MGTVQQCVRCRKFFKVLPNSSYKTEITKDIHGKYSCFRADFCPACNERLFKTSSEEINLREDAFKND